MRGRAGTREPGMRALEVRAAVAGAEVEAAALRANPRAEPVARAEPPVCRAERAATRWAPRETGGR